MTTKQTITISCAASFILGCGLGIIGTRHYDKYISDDASRIEEAMNAWTKYSGGGDAPKEDDEIVVDADIPGAINVTVIENNDSSDIYQDIAKNVTITPEEQEMIDELFADVVDDEPFETEDDEYVDFAYRFDDVKNADLSVHHDCPYVISYEQANQLVGIDETHMLVDCYFYPGNDWIVVQDKKDDLESVYGMGLEELIGPKYWKEYENYNHDDCCYICNDDLGLVFAIVTAFNDEDEFIDLFWDMDE